MPYYSHPLKACFEFLVEGLKVHLCALSSWIRSSFGCTGSSVIDPLRAKQLTFISFTCHNEPSFWVVRLGMFVVARFLAEVHNLGFEARNSGFPWLRHVAHALSNQDA